MKWTFPSLSLHEYSNLSANVVIVVLLCCPECGCVNGECNSGPDGNGECYCQPPYTGPRCDQVSAACKNCSAYSHCKGVVENAVCQCLPGFHKTGDRCSGVCSAKQCDVNADCSWLGGRLFQCQCKAGYKGDGRMCVPINPCDEDNGGCPRNSAVCVYTSPGKSRCDCMHGWEGSTPSSGCTLKNVCYDTTCHTNVRCETGLDGYPRRDLANSPPGGLLDLQGFAPDLL
ncbi:stabilin-2-like [Salvelinus sp. IW2-2015]|uniref:stabilin-2-like n=1 Tax=Salvelinus sp. IW2-2015 TaxID=2691554 RepID=UPI000CEAA580|nr:stabilin-2-like [Salvelinus alpinus]